VLKRIAAIASVLFAAGALTVGSVTVANAVTTPVIHWRAETHLSADVDVTCPSTFENYYGTGGSHGNGQYFYNRVGSPYQLLANTAHTGYCPEASNFPGDQLVAILNTSGLNICLEVSGTTHSVYGANCNSASKAQAVRLNLEGTYNGDDVVEVEFNKDTGGCIYQDGRDSPVEWHTCSASNTGDLWILS
jgi:hypothetical protein